MSDPVAAPGGLRYLRHFTGFSLAAVVLLAAAVTTADAVSGGPSGTQRFAAAGYGLAAAVGVVCVISALLFHQGVYGTRSPWPGRLLPLGVVTALVAYTGAQATGDQLWPWVTLPALLTGGVLVATPWPRLPVAALGISLTGVAALAGGALAGEVRWWQSATAAVATGLCIAALMTQVWVWDIARRADRGRVLEAELALDRERLRFAAELHDIQGHSLQVIALKSELAARLAAVDPARAAAEMGQVQALARDALRDTRDVVHGYRAVALHTEISNAVAVLAAAGVRCRTRLAAVDGVPAADERLLALVVREATTNVIRHSAAGHAEISLQRTPGGVRLAVGNDAPLPATSPGGGPAGGPGGGPAGGPGGGPAGGPGGGPAGGPGGGLVGLAQRFAAAGGQLTWRRDGGRFEVSATLPDAAGRTA